MAGSTSSRDSAAALGGKKRAQIQLAEKNIFVWLSASAVIVSICLVATQFLVREMMFNNKVISAKANTNKTLVKNIENAKTLQTNLDKLIADKGLASVGQQAAGSTAKASNLKVILDALPVEPDATGFANSLQTVVLPKSGATITELPTSFDTQGEVSEDSKAPQMMAFRTSFEGNYETVSKTLGDISRVIRPIHVNTMTLKSGDNKSLKVSIEGNTYYLPHKTISVKTVQCSQKDKECGGEED